MEDYEQLEISILSCLIQKPELMKTFEIEDKYFITKKKLWTFMKEFYEKFKTLDIVIMCSVVSNRVKFAGYLREIAEAEPVPDMIEKYKERIIEMYDESKKDKWIIDKVFIQANKLLVRQISVKDFKLAVDKIYQDAEELERLENENNI